MSKRRQKGTRNHRSLNLFEKGWLSADVGFTMIKRNISKIEGHKINIRRAFGPLACVIIYWLWVN